jgi:RNA recognition motif-containing protein
VIAAQTAADYAAVAAVQQQQAQQQAYQQQYGSDGEGKKKKKFVRTIGGLTWEDPTLADWPTNDFRIFVGDLGPEANDDTLKTAFGHYGSFARARVVRDKKTGQSRGYGFVSFLDAKDYMRAFREMQGKFVGTRPVKLRKSEWQDRNIDVRRAKDKDAKKNIYRFANQQ